MEDILDFDTSGYLRINRDGDINHITFITSLSLGYLVDKGDLWKAGQLGWMGVDRSGRVGDLEPCRSIHIYYRLWVGCTKSVLNDMNSKSVHCSYEVPVNDHIAHSI